MTEDEAVAIANKHELAACRFFMPDHEFPEGYRPPAWIIRAIQDAVRDPTERLAGLLYELWRDGVLSEQQCAKRYGVDLVTMRRLLDERAQAAGFSGRGEAQDAQPWKPFATCCEYVRDEGKSEGLYEAGVALAELQRAVEAILEDGHMNQELLARLRAAYEFGCAPEETEEQK